MLNEKALEAACNSIMRSTGHTTFEKSVELSITAYLAALPSSPASDLVEALRECAEMVREGKCDMLSEFWHDEAAKLTAEACAEAADRLTALEAENARLRALAVGDEDPDEPCSYRQLAVCLLLDFERYAEDETSARRMVSVNGYKEDLERIDAKAALTAPQGGNHGE